MTGLTSTTNFPTVNAFQPNYGGNDSDGFVAELNPAGSGLVYSSYLGGSDSDAGLAVALDIAGNTYVTGYTLATDFPTTQGRLSNPDQRRPRNCQRLRDQDRSASHSSTWDPRSHTDLRHLCEDLETAVVSPHVDLKNPVVGSTALPAKGIGLIDSSPLLAQSSRVRALPCVEPSVGPSFLAYQSRGRRNHLAAHAADQCQTTTFPARGEASTQS